MWEIQNTKDTKEARRKLESDFAISLSSEMRVGPFRDHGRAVGKLTATEKGNDLIIEV